jgi:hypothetical protein
LSPRLLIVKISLLTKSCRVIEISFRTGPLTQVITKLSISLNLSYQ